MDLVEVGSVCRPSQVEVDHNPWVTVAARGIGSQAAVVALAGL